MDRTDDDGRFEAVVSRVAGERFIILAGGYAPYVRRPEAAPQDRKFSGPEIVLVRGAPLFGRVTHPPPGRGIPRAWVRLEHPHLPGQVIAQLMTDGDGGFRFEAIDDLPHVLYAFPPVDDDLCLPQLRLEGVRGGRDPFEVVIPDAAYATVRFLARGTADPVVVQHLTLVVKDHAAGAAVVNPDDPRTRGRGARSPRAEARVRSCRIRIDVPPELARRLRLAAANRDIGPGRYVLEAVKRRLRQDLGAHRSPFLSVRSDPVLAELHANPRDARYDRL